AVARGQVHAVPLARRLGFEVELILGHAEEDAHPLVVRIAGLGAAGICRQLDLIDAPRRRLLLADLQLDALELLGRQAVESLASQVVCRQRVEWFLSANERDLLFAERCCGLPAEGI